MDERKLTPAADEDLIQSLAFALRYNRSGKRVSDRDVMTSTMAAQHLVSMLKLSGYIVMKGPPAPAHAAPPPSHAHLYDPARSKPPARRLDASEDDAVGQPDAGAARSDSDS